MDPHAAPRNTIDQIPTEASPFDLTRATRFSASGTDSDTVGGPYESATRRAMKLALGVQLLCAEKVASERSASLGSSREINRGITGEMLAFAPCTRRDVNLAYHQPAGPMHRPKRRLPQFLL